MAEGSYKRHSSWIIILLALIILAGLILYARLFTFNLGNLRQGGVTSDGGEVYAISQNFRTDGPRFEEVDINPRKASLGDKQILVARMENPKNVSWVKAVTELDSSVKEINLEKVGDNEWRGEWIVEDTSTKTYRTTFIAAATGGKENRFTLAWSDPCSGIPLGGDGTLGADCTISGVDGIDNGSLNLNGRTLTIPAGATFVWNSGKTITANGTIAVSGQLKKTYLWIKDADNDGYAPNATDELAQDSQPAGYQRRYTRVGTTDCNDADVSKYQNLSGYQDSDGDGYGVGSVQNVCSGSSLAAGWVNNASDCYDSNANAKPGQTSVFSSNRGDGSFDYDCDGGISASPYDIGTGLNFGGGQCCYSHWYATTDGYLNSGHCGQTVGICRPYYAPGGNCGGCGSYFCGDTIEATANVSCR